MTEAIKFWTTLLFNDYSRLNAISFFEKLNGNKLAYVSNHKLLGVDSTTPWFRVNLNTALYNYISTLKGKG